MVHQFSIRMKPKTDIYSFTIIENLKKKLFPLAYNEDVRVAKKDTMTLLTAISMASKDD